MKLRDALLEPQFDRRQARFSSVEPPLRRVRGGNAHLSQAVRLLAQVPDRFFVNTTKRGPLVVDRLLELLHSLRGVSLQSGAGRLEGGQLRLELIYGALVPLAGGRPPLEDGRRQLIELGEALTCLGTLDAVEHG
jgi:hypothetical protein